MPSEEKLLIIKSPEVAKEWHPTKNGSLKPYEFAAKSSKRIWWKCSLYPQHIWESSISTRTRTKTPKCPFCLGIRVSETNSLEKLSPEIAKEWHPTKNKELKPSDVTNKSGKKVWWQCPKHANHVYDMPFVKRIDRGDKCPLCSRKRKNK